MDCSKEKPHFSIRRTALKTAVAYAVFGGLWIAFSDMALAAVITDAATMSTIQTYKGWLFIGVTAVLLYGMVARNLLALKKFEAALSAKEIQLESVFKAASNVAFIMTAEVDGDMIVEEFSPGAEKLFMLQAADVLNCHVPDLPLPQQLFGKDKRDKHQQLQFTRPDGTVNHLFATTVKLPTEDKEAYLSVIADMTSHKHMQDSLVQTEKMMSVGGLAAGMAHELNNPLGGIVQGTQNIKRRLLGDLTGNRNAAETAGCTLEAIQEYVDSRGITSMLNGVAECGSRAGQIVAHMVEFAKPGNTSLVPARVENIVDGALILAGRDYDMRKRYDFKNVDVQKDLAEDIPELVCTPAEIEQVLLSLFRNAAQAMHESERPPHLTVRASEEGGYARIEVEDNGYGMTDDTQKRMFEPFFTTRDVGEGTGLGLAVAYFIVVTKHQGRIDVVSSPETGTHVTLRLPFAA